MLPTIHTARLDLIALSATQLRLCCADPAAFERAEGIALAPAALTDATRRAIGVKLEKMAHAPAADHAWYTYWLIVVRAAQRGVGMAGFKGAPWVQGRYDGVGEVEIGYGLAPDYEGHGLMTETVRALIGWAFACPDCHAVIAPGVLKTNIGSNRVLAKAGLSVYGETETTRSWRIDRQDPPG